jgi:serine phosphatase RsbU (regulator of sigma subunit)
VRALQELLTELRAWLLAPLEADPARRRRAEQVFHQARVVAAGAAERQEANRRLESERLTGILAQTARALITSFDVESLPHTLSGVLPRLGIGAAYHLLYVGEGDPPKQSRMLLGYDSAHVGLHGQGFKVPTLELVPKALLPRGRRYSLVSMPLYFEDDQLGFALFEWGPRNGAIYEALREFLSAALKGARLVRDLAEEAAQREKAERERLAKELEIATRIQTSILPRNLSVAGLELAALMRPATEVGGDYYDVLPSQDGAWLCIGDVAGHGLRPGLVMMMLQSIVATATSYTPDADPVDVVCVVNDVLYENVRCRLQQDEHATLSVMRYHTGGRVELAGAHEEILIWRKESDHVEVIPTPGTWVGATREIRSATTRTEFTLQAGDVMLLYTDGVIEAEDRLNRPYGIERLSALFKQRSAQPVETIVKAILADVRSYLSVQRDDIALLVARQVS